METDFSPSEKVPTSAFPSWVPSFLQMSRASLGLELPEKILMSLPCAIISASLTKLLFFLSFCYATGRCLHVTHFLPLARRRLAAHWTLMVWGHRAMHRLSAGTSSVTVLPAAV